ncbi:MAG TPA: hypothetical protein VFM28_08865 [Nitrososphaeraceae archaeon]|nr:hypothetical protein [Nitrososphaeraceae archaeon]
MINSTITGNNYATTNIVYNKLDKEGSRDNDFDNDKSKNDTDNSKECIYKMISPKCPRCGGEYFLELEQHHVDYSEELKD